MQHRGEAYKPVRVFWICSGYIVLQLHVGFFLESLYLWDIIYARMIWYKNNVYAQSDLSTPRNLLLCKSGGIVYAPGLKSTIALR